MKFNDIWTEYEYVASLKINQSIYFAEISKIEGAMKLVINYPAFKITALTIGNHLILNQNEDRTIFRRII